MAYHVASLAKAKKLN